MSAVSKAAAPSREVVWPSWPQACMTLGLVEACGTPLVSRIGSASISARRPTDRLDWPRLIVATMPLPPTPAMKGTPSSVSRAWTKAAVSCSCSVSSGLACR